MAYTALGEKEVGSIVKLNRGGKPWEFIVVHQGLPGEVYDESCDGTWLFMRGSCKYAAWGRSGNTNYADSWAHTDLNEAEFSLLDANIQAHIKQIKLPYCPDGSNLELVNSGADGLETKLLFLSVTEGGGVRPDAPITGPMRDYFKNCAEDGEDDKRGFSIVDLADYWLRDPKDEKNIYNVNRYGAFGSYYPEGNTVAGIRQRYRFALILPPAIMVFDDGMICTGTAPEAPANIMVPENAQGGAGLEIAWGEATDPDGNLSGYELERQVDGGEWTQVYKGKATSYTDTITRGWLTVAYRVRAYDSLGLYSDYTTSPTREVNNNRAPIITCGTASGSDLGTKTEDFTIPYSAADADGDPVTITEAIDGTALRTFTPEADAPCAFAVTGETFMKLLNGTHTLTITASDGQAQAVHTLGFTKSVTAASVTLAQPMEADGPITLCVLSVTGSIPEGAAYSVKVTNNGRDSAPVWEDCTDEVKLGANHVFTNETAANGFAFNFKVEVERGENGQGGCINSVQGGFE